MNPLSTAKLILISCAIGAAAAMHAAPADPEPDVLDMSIEENLASPEVPSKARTYVRTDIDRLRRRLLSQGYTATATRQGEVLEVSIPASLLFAANDTVVKPSGAEKLAAFGELAREPRRYKIIIAAHSDDTGDETYSDHITAARANAIDDALWHMAGGTDTNTVPYGLGRDEPLRPNTSRKDRETNRRIELYIVPDTGLLEAAGVKIKK